MYVARALSFPRTIFKCTTVSLGGRTLPAPRGLRRQMSDIKEKKRSVGVQGWLWTGRHTWSSSTWHLALAAVGLLTAAFLKASDLWAFLGKQPVCKCSRIGKLNFLLSQDIDCLHSSNPIPFVLLIKLDFILWAEHFHHMKQLGWTYVRSEELQPSYEWVIFVQLNIFWRTGYSMKPI